MAIELPSHRELFEIGKAALLLADDQDRFSDRSIDTDGYIINILTNMAAGLSEEAVHVAYQLYLRTFLRTATGDDLEALAEDHWNVTRNGGAQAVGSLRFSRLSTAAGNIAIPSGQQATTADGVVFETTAAATLSTLQVDVPARAVLAGESGNASAVQITGLATALPGDLSITVSNPLLFAGGLRVETDDELRERVREFIATLPRGTRAALEFGAKSVPGVVSATADESDPPFIYIADIDGNSNPTLEAAVRSELENWRAFGITVNVGGATLVNQPVSVAFTFASGVDTAKVATDAIAAMIDYGGSLAIGETLYQAALAAAALAIDGIVDADVTIPAGNVQPTTQELLRTPVVTVL